MLTRKKIKVLVFFTIVVNLSLLSFARAGNLTLCKKAFLAPTIELETTFSKLKSKGFVVETETDLVAISHPKNNTFYAFAELNKRTLSLGLSFRERNGKLKIEGLTGSEFFKIVIAHFEGKIDYIQGHWEDGVNLEKINLMTSADKLLEIEDIVHQTWTGNQAKKYGFNNVRLVRAEGSHGDYSFISIEFYREANY